MDRVAEVDNVLVYTAPVTIPLPIQNKIEMEREARSSMPVAMVTRDGKTSIRRPTDTRDAAVNEYRRLHGLQPIPHANATMVNGTLSMDIEVHYEMKGGIPLPPTAVKNAQAGAAAVFGIQMTPMEGNDGKTLVRVQGTAPREGNREFVRTRGIIRQRSPTPPQPDDVDVNDNDMVVPKYPFRLRSGDKDNKKGGRRGGK